MIALDEVAVLTRPGAAPRRPEVAPMATALAGLCELRQIEAPGTLDGGDVLRLDRVLYVGQSSRSSGEGVAQLARLLAPFGYRIESVPLRGCLHLKSAVTRIASDRLLVNPEWVDATRFDGFEAMPIDPTEPHAANALLVGPVVIHSASWPRTNARLRATGIDVREVDMSEMEKAEGAVTCCSVILDR